MMDFDNRFVKKRRGYCWANALLPLFSWFWKLKLFPESSVSSPETTWLFCSDDCDCPIPCDALLPSSSSSSPPL